jgi:hypothetical protein
MAKEHNLIEGDGGLPLCSLLHTSEQEGDKDEP